MRQTVSRWSVTGWRRAWIGLVAVLAIASPALAEGLSSFGATQLSAIRVNVGPLLAQGGGAPAEALRDDLLGALNREFADRIGGAGPVLVVRIKSLSLRPYTGSEGGRSGFGGGFGSAFAFGRALRRNPPAGTAVSTCPNPACSTSLVSVPSSSAFEASLSTEALRSVCTAR